MNIKICYALTISVLSFSQSPYSLADEPTECEYDSGSMLALDQRDFDQAPDMGWRIVERSGDCRLVAADLIRTYIETNGEEGVIMTWHEGQLRAFVGQTEQALRLLESTRVPTDQEDRFGWNFYVDATTAFLRNNKEQLVHAREDLASLQRPQDFEPVDSFGKPVKVRWPPNLNVVDGLLDCFGESYDYAYNNCVGPFTESTKN